jgi:carbonic anhydrase
MKNLMPGLRKFTENVFPIQKELFETLSQGQKPHTLLITCSDSRIDPNLLTQTQPGELFVIRNAGNIIPPFGSSGGGEEAAIEFAIDGLNVSNIVICGHSHCGAIAALMDKVDLNPLPSVKHWLRHAQSTKKRILSCSKRNDYSLSDVVEENIFAQIDNLKTHPSVSSALREDKIRIYGWIYQLETGEIRIFDQKSKQFVNTSEVKEELINESNRFEL